MVNGALGRSLEFSMYSPERILKAAFGIFLRRTLGKSLAIERKNIYAIFCKQKILLFHIFGLCRVLCLLHLIVFQPVLIQTLVWLIVLILLINKHRISWFTKSLLKITASKKVLIIFLIQSCLVVHFIYWVKVLIFWNFSTLNKKHTFFWISLSFFLVLHPNYCKSVQEWLTRYLNNPWLLISKNLGPTSYRAICQDILYQLYENVCHLIADTIA